MAHCENGRYNPLATNKNTDGSTDHGIFQVNDKWHKDRFTKLYGSWELIYSPQHNIEYAIKYIRLPWGNWNAWTCKRWVQ